MSTFAGAANRTPYAREQRVRMRRLGGGHFVPISSNDHAKSSLSLICQPVDYCVRERSAVKRLPVARCRTSGEIPGLVIILPCAGQ
jgi:hypothetical protein